jgi:hypothetical protein
MKIVVLLVPENIELVLRPIVKTQPKQTHDTTGEEVHPSSLPPRKTEAA